MEASPQFVPAPPSEERGDDRFVIPATTSFHDRQLRTAKHGDTFAVFDAHGDAFAGGGGAEGLYHRDTRHLSHLLMTIDGARPILLSSTVRDADATLVFDLTNPDLHDREGADHIAHDRIHVRRSRFLHDGGCHERLVVQNFDVTPRRIGLSFSFGADFADLFEVRGHRRPRRGEIHPPVIETDRVYLAYTGLDGVRRETELRFDPRPDGLAGDRAGWVLDLAPGAARVLHLSILCRPMPDDRRAGRLFAAALHDRRRAQRRRAARAVDVTTSNELFDECLRRAVGDLDVLVAETPEGPYPHAGIPWFATVFGRDGLITALETLWYDPAIARGVLRHLAALQATVFDAAADAEPGKILHEMRWGEMAELGEVPFRRYYGSIDSTPLFLMLAGAYFERTDDLATMAEIWPNLEAALAWIRDHGDRDGDGFVEYGRHTEAGLSNQGWKDSADSVFHADGRLAVGPIALVEVQAYVHAALRGIAPVAARLGRAEAALELEQRAAELRLAFDAAFFDDELGTYVIALDGEKRPCRVATSNAGHALLSGIALPERAASVVAALMGPASFSGWGVRTVAADAPRYNPMSYHDGSVWPHDNALIALGLSRYGFRDEAARIFEGLFAAAVHFDLRRLPELFCGLPRRRAQGPTAYPVACSPQAWAAAAPFALLQASLGLAFDSTERRLVFDRPRLPAFLDEVTIRGLELCGATIDVTVRRVGEEAAVSVLRREGDIGIRVTG